jgi:hypothetical protein
MGMTIQEGQALLGKTGYLSGALGAVRFEVVITDVKSAYGDVRVLVTPKAGEGTAWVSLNRVQLV